MSSISAGTTSGTALVSTGDTTGTLDLKTGAGATTALSIDASQRVGIGTSSPAQRLDVRTTSGNAYVGVGRASQSTGQVGLTLYGGTSGTDWIIYQPTSSNNLTFYGNGSDQVVITSGGKVGIGVTNPSALLDVRGSAPYMYVSDTVGANKAAFVAEATNTVVNVGSTYLGAAAVPLALVVGGAEKARIDSSGNLGLGVTPSATTGSGVKGFEIGGIGNGLLGNSANVWATQNVYFNAGFKKAGAGYATMYNQSGGTHNWNVSTTSGGAAGDAITFTQAMTLDASGNLGIGTSSPNDKLTVASDNYLSFQTSSTTFNSGRVARIGGVSVGSGNGYLSFETYQGGSGGGERMRLESDGLLQISKGTYTGFWIGDAGYKMFVTAGRLVAQNGSNGVELAFNASAWAAYSDIRAKTSLTPITDAKTKLKTARTVTGRYITDSEDVSRSFLIAQDWFEILPESVDASDPERLSLRYTETIPLIAAAVNEQTDEIAELKAIIESLTARIAALEAQ